MARRRLFTQSNATTVLLAATGTALGIAVFTPLFRDAFTWIRGQMNI